jgi:uncharacterized cupin superfamily protein
MDNLTAQSVNQNKSVPAEILVGHRVRELRNRQGLSLRALAERSGLNVNTLWLIENGKSSPSVSTLQQLALALKVTISSFFESDPVEKKVVFTPAGQSPPVSFGGTQLQNLGQDLAGNAVQPFIVTLAPDVGSGDRMIVHTGFEFVYCLAGSIRYLIDGEEYHLNPGDSLVFEAHLPHCWENKSNVTARILLIFSSTDARDEPGGQHFMFEDITRKSP